MEIFKLDKKFSSWGEVYLGLLKNWLCPIKIIKYCEKGKINCTSERLVNLNLALDDSLFAFLSQINTFIKEDDNIHLKVNIDTQTIDFSKIPSKYWELWKVEFLLRLINSKNSKEEKIYKIESLYTEFNYPTEWHDFLYYMPVTNEDNPIGIDGLYNNLHSYLNHKLKLML